MSAELMGFMEEIDFFLSTIPPQLRAYCLESNTVGLLLTAGEGLKEHLEICVTLFQFMHSF